MWTFETSGKHGCVIIGLSWHCEAVSCEGEGRAVQTLELQAEL